VHEPAALHQKFLKVPTRSEKVFMTGIQLDMDKVLGPEEDLLRW